MSARGVERTQSKGHHTSPEELVRDPGLSEEEKSSVLEQWAYDEKLIAVAVDEGMPGPEPELLRRVSCALSELRSLVVTPPGGEATPCSDPS